MKSRTIKLILLNRFNHWAKSIDDAAVKKLVENNTIITGGSIVSLLLNEDVSDFDVYFRNRETAIEVASYYVSKFLASPPEAWSDKEIKVRVDNPVSVRLNIQSAGVVGEGNDSYAYFESEPDEAAMEYVQKATEAADTIEVPDAGKKSKYLPIFMSQNAITLSDKVQVVLRFYGEPDEIHKNYDFVHCTNYWCSWDRKLVLRPDAVECCINKELRYQGSLYPICSLFRIRKFIKRGWTITAGQILKMALQISKLNLEDMANLEEQLIGVDAAYFRDLIERLKEKSPDKVDGNYLMTLLDTMI